MSLKLYEFQNEYFKNVKKNWIYNMDTGTGKTIMGLNHYMEYFNDCKLVIVAPASKIKEQGWQRTIDQYIPKCEYQILSYNVLNKKINELEGDLFIIFDEGHRLKNSTGVWGKAGYKLSQKAKGFIILTATPTPNGWEDVVNYFKMFGLVKNKTEFFKKYCITDNKYGFLRIIGFKKEEELNIFWSLISKRLNKNDALDLPDLIFETKIFKPSTKYKKIKKDKVWQGEIFDTSISLRHALRASTSKDDKINYLLSFLEDTEENVLIFYNYKEELEALKKEIQKTNKVIYECNGETHNYPLKGNWDNIKNTVTLANYKSGSEAVELTYCNIIIYFTPSESYAEYTQSIGRCYRAGQNKKVTVYKYITINTIETQIYQALDKKEDFNFRLWLEEEERGKK